MPQITKAVNAPKGELEHQQSALRQQMKKYGISPRSIMSIFGQTNPQTIQKWMDGSDIPLNALLAICNSYELNPLMFITYAGHEFKSTIEDLYRLEAVGLTIGDVLRKMGIDAYNEPQCMHTLRTAEDIAKANSEREENKKRYTEQYKRHTLKEQSLLNTQFSTSDMIDKIMEFQRQAFEHEQNALNELRERKDEEITTRDQTIVNLKMKLVRLGYQGYVGDANSMIADND